jgi:hypothetical protein
MTPRPTIGHLMAAIEAARLRHPGFGWYRVPRCPNGRYWVDHTRNLVFVDARQDCNAGAAAILDGIAELDAAHGVTGDIVVPLQRPRSHRRAARCR